MPVCYLHDARLTSRLPGAAHLRGIRSHVRSIPYPQRSTGTEVVTPRTASAPRRRPSRFAVAANGSRIDAEMSRAPMRARLVSLLLRPESPPLWLGLVVVVPFIVVETGVVIAFKDVAPGSAFGVVYLLGVLVVSTVWGFGLSAALSVASALAFDYFRDWPGPFSFGADDWAVIGVFVMVALMANTLAYLVRTHAVEADQRRPHVNAAAINFGPLRNCSRPCDGWRHKWPAELPLQRCSSRWRTNWRGVWVCSTRLWSGSRSTAALFCWRRMTTVGRSCHLALGLRTRARTSRQWSFAPAARHGWTATTVLPVLAQR